MFNFKKVLTSGCSFSVGGWALELNELILDRDFLYLASSAAGNKYISDSVIMQPLDSYDIALVMWSGLNRLDFPVDNQLVESYNFKSTKINDVTYVHSGGYFFKKNDAVVDTLFSGVYKVLTPTNLAYLSLTEIIKTQNYLENNNKKYIFMSHVNCWDSNNKYIRVHDLHIRNCNNTIQQLIDKINFQNWAFDENKDGIFEYACKNNFLGPDRYHPNNDANKYWANKLYDILLKKFSI